MDGMPSWWALDIQEHDFRIVHHKGQSQNANAGPLTNPNLPVSCCYSSAKRQYLRSSHMDKAEIITHFSGTNSCELNLRLADGVISQ